MTTRHRGSAVTAGQRVPTDSATLRRRDQSGIRIGGDTPLLYLRRLDRLRALIESIGPPCWAFGPTAAALHGFDGFELEPPFHLVVPIERAPHRVDHVVHRARAIIRLDTSHAHEIPSMSATRTLIDLAGRESPARLTAALDSALRDGLTSEDFLHRRIVELRSRGRAGLAALLGVIEGSERTRGAHSWLERAFLELVAELALPRPVTQQVVGARNGRLIRVDCRFPGTNVVVELLGYRFHRTQLQMQADAERLNRMVLDGLRPMQFTYTDIVTRSVVMLETLAEALPHAAA